MKEFDDLHDYVSNMIDVVNQINKLGKDSNEQKVVERLLRSLPKKWPYCGCNRRVRRLDLTQLIVDELLSSLYSLKDRIKRYDNDDDVTVEHDFHSQLQVTQDDKGVGNSRNQGNFYKGHGGNFSWKRQGKFSAHYGEENQHLRNNNGSQKDGLKQCYYCNNYGHIKSIYKLKEKHTKLAQEEKKDETESESFFVACFSARECPPGVWYIDNRCSNHMTSDLEIFTTLDKSMTRRITLGDGTICEAQGKGTVKLNPSGLSYIKNVLYVPDLNSNFLIYVRWLFTCLWRFYMLCVKK